MSKSLIENLLKTANNNEQIKLPLERLIKKHLKIILSRRKRRSKTKIY
ncbi:MAG: hypothetical protein LBI55_02025 [Oscillospiraceae bacterium]|jgi:hypothetical protein|nr:hypothetical protein [Oscillospiraceae bacterium]